MSRINILNERKLSSKSQISKETLLVYSVYCVSTDNILMWICKVQNLYRGINDFQSGYQSRSNLVKDENVDLLTDSRNILNRWRKLSVTERT
jgi:hypothetical protein